MAELSQRPGERLTQPCNGFIALRVTQQNEGVAFLEAHCAIEGDLERRAVHAARSSNGRIDLLLRDFINKTIHLQQRDVQTVLQQEFPWEPVLDAQFACEASELPSIGELGKDGQEQCVCEQAAMRRADRVWTKQRRRRIEPGQAQL